MKVYEYSRKFYEDHIAGMIKDRFPEYENRIAVGIAGEGSDCFGYDDVISRDHDFGTGVCLWVTDEDMDRFGYSLSIAYNELVDRVERISRESGIDLKDPDQRLQLEILLKAAQIERLLRQ